MPLHVKNKGNGYNRQKFDMVGSHDNNIDNMKIVESKKLNESRMHIINILY